MNTIAKISYSDAIQYFRKNKDYQQLITDSYLDENTEAAAKRFSESAEFAEVLKILPPVAPRIVLDIGAGNGIASYAFAKSGAKEVIALEPDEGNVTGSDVIRKLTVGLSVRVVQAYAESSDLPDSSADIVYGRQVLHHIKDIKKAFEEISRMLKPGGKFIFAREPVVDDEEGRKSFLESHPMHMLVQNENAYTQEEYIAPAINAGLKVEKVFQHWDTVINGYPSVRSELELVNYPGKLLALKFGFAGQIMGGIPLLRHLVKKRLSRKVPGRLITFFGIKS